MNFARRILAWARKGIVLRFGFIRLMEWRNQILLAPLVPPIWWFERSEIDRLRGQLGGAIPSARVACIIPTYKRHKMLLEAVDSILKQDFQDFVVIIVDDGAGLPHLPDDPRVFGLSLSRNSGTAGVVRNVGIRLSKSEYIAFLDDDNTWTSNHLGDCVEQLNIGVDLVYTDVRRRTPSGKIVDILSADFNRTELTKSSSVDTSAIMIRRKKDVLFSRLPRTRNTMPGEDWEFVFRLSHKAQVAHIPKVTVEYLIHQDSFYTPWTEDLTSS